MRRRIVICIIIVFVFFIAVGMADQRAEVKTPQSEQSYALQTETEEEAVESSLYETAYQYVILEDEGHLMVYLPDRTTIYFDTGILSSALPASLYEQLADGIFFYSEEELYEFLENYSS